VLPHQKPQKRLDKAEQYSKKALEVLPTLVKPAELSDTDFLKAKDQTSALAYSGLGLVAFRRQKFAEAIPNFEQAVKLDPLPDPVNLYLLASRTRRLRISMIAVSAVHEVRRRPWCLAGHMQDRRRRSKKMATTQLSAPQVISPCRGTENEREDMVRGEDDR